MADLTHPPISPNYEEGSLTMKKNPGPREPLGASAARRNTRRSAGSTQWDDRRFRSRGGFKATMQRRRVRLH
jgi:hypothetical protein